LSSLSASHCASGGIPAAAAAVHQPAITPPATAALAHCALRPDVNTQGGGFQNDLAWRTGFAARVNARPARTNTDCILCPKK